MLLDDDILRGVNQTDHSNCLCQVLECLQKVVLKLNQAKFQTGARSIKFISFQVDKFGIHPTDDKVKAIKNAPTPQNIKKN